MVCGTYRCDPGHVGAAGRMDVTVTATGCPYFFLIPPFAHPNHQTTPADFDGGGLYHGKGIVDRGVVEPALSAAAKPGIPAVVT